MVVLIDSALILARFANRQLSSAGVSDSPVANSVRGSAHEDGRPLRLLGDRSPEWLAQPQIERLHLGDWEDNGRGHGELRQGDGRHTQAIAAMVRSDRHY